MALPLYLAMTAGEMESVSALPPCFAYMACHFSPYGTGLSNIPVWLPGNAMLIVNDRTPISGHAPEQIRLQLDSLVRKLRCSCVLLDFQRPGTEETAAVVQAVSATLPCPVGVSECYAQPTEYPVFLPPAPLDVPLAEYLAPWQGREIWLETALDSCELTLTEDGCSTALLPPFSEVPSPHADKGLHIHYRIKEEAHSARFSLCRTYEDLQELLEEADSLGVKKAIGLWQELG